MNSSQSRCASSTRSSNGSFLAATKSFFTDTNLIYSFELAAPAAFSASANGCNPVGVGRDFSSSTQGSSFLATLGWMTQSLRDWHWPNHANPTTRRRQSAIGNWPVLRSSTAEGGQPAIPV
jgi:hypothetical protein